MSLDVYLRGEPREVECVCSECGDEHSKQHRETFFSANITHNLGKMAGEAGIYEACWRPGELLDPQKSALMRERAEAEDWHGPDGVFAIERTLPEVRGRDIIPTLREGLSKLESSPEWYSQFNAKNGWGLYEHFVPWVRSYLAACETYPDALVEVSR
jgi:hypothetical protein